MNLGTEIPDEVMSTFRELTMGKKYLYLVLEIENKKTVVVSHSKERVEKTDTLDYEEFKDLVLAEYGSSKSCYGVLDFTYEADGETKNKVVLILWNPEDAGFSKFIYSGAFENLRTSFEGIQKTVQAFDDADLECENIIACCEKL